MECISFFDAKPYDKLFFDECNKKYGFEILYHEEKLSPKTATFAKDSDAVCAFVNDDIGTETISRLYEQGIRVLALRCAGFNNVDFKNAFGKIHVVRVPAYSPYAVAEHTMALLLTLNRKLHKAYNRTRDFNFSLNGLTGIDLHGRTVGVIGTGKIGQCFINICKGFGMEVLAYDPYPNPEVLAPYVSLDELLRQSDIISLHCPLTKENQHLINAESIAKMKQGVILLNTSRGALVDSKALLDGLLQEKIRATGLDVYEEEADMFYEDNSYNIVQDEILSRLLTLPNVLLTSHQAFLTEEALQSIAETTLHNLKEYFAGAPLTNEICYHCTHDPSHCPKKKNGRCF
ncbi:MAG: 2-hydroxyacid dehydrogenase [Lachnospiraceae bacterium]